MFLGYYRSNYSITDWALIIGLLEANYTKVAPISRSLLIDDAFNLAHKGYVSYSIVIDLMNCWRFQETEYLPWKILLNNLNVIYQYSSDLPAFNDIKVQNITFR